MILLVLVYILQILKMLSAKTFCKVNKFCLFSWKHQLPPEEILAFLYERAESFQTASWGGLIELYLYMYGKTGAWTHCTEAQNDL